VQTARRAALADTTIAALLMGSEGARSLVPDRTDTALEPLAFDESAFVAAD